MYSKLSTCQHAWYLETAGKQRCKLLCAQRTSAVAACLRTTCVVILSAS